jgi:hypothetical protein
MGPAVTFDVTRRHLAPGVPVVFCGADDVDMATRPAGMTGTIVRRVFGLTRDLGLRLQPDTRHVFVVGGTSGFDRRLRRPRGGTELPWSGAYPAISLTCR